MQTLGDLLRTRALEYPRRTALFTPGAEISYEELDSASTRMACWIVNQGLQPGDRIALHWYNSFEAALLYFAAFKAGVIAVPVNLRMKAPEIAYVFENSGATLCFSAPPFAALAQAAAASCPGMKSIFSVIPSEAMGATLPAVDPVAPAAILYTSGTTGRPKGVLCSHHAFLECCRCVGPELRGEGSPGLCTTPMMHVGGLYMVIGSVSRGTAAVLLPGFDPAATLDAIERYQCTLTMALPAFLQFMADEQARKPRDVRSLRTVLAGGDCVPRSLQIRFQELFSIPLQEFYGMTEGGFIAINPKHDVRDGSMGAPLSEVQLRMVDSEGRDVPPGETGEIVLKSPMASGGYWNDPEATAGLWRDGWLHTGDLACRDADGYLWFRGRSKQIIVRGGSNISPQEVEEALYEHPAVREAGVVGEPDSLYGEVVVAFVALRSGSDPAAGESELREFTRARLADYKIPERFMFLPELPKGLTGKVDRRALKEILLAQARSAATV